MGFDLVEFNPFYDNRGQQTARLCRRVMLSFLTGIAMKKDGIDPDYGNELRQASKNGVEIHVYDVSFSASGIRMNRPVPYEL